MVLLGLFITFWTWYKCCCCVEQETAEGIRRPALRFASSSTPNTPCTPRRLRPEVDNVVLSTMSSTSVQPTPKWRPMPTPLHRRGPNRMDDQHEACDELLPVPFNWAQIRRTRNGVRANAARAARLGSVVGPRAAPAALSRVDRPQRSNSR
jgi:hypothetical protein